MLQAAVSPLLPPWANFYVIIGSAAAALTGLMFVVITLIASIRIRNSGDGVDAFGTPIVVHFCMTLLVAVTLSAPWHTLWHLGLLIGIFGIWGIVYFCVVLRRAHRQTDYEALQEDWWWYIFLPFVPYVIFMVAGVLFFFVPEIALDSIALAVVMLPLIAIRNAWDTVAYLVINHIQAESKG